MGRFFKSLVSRKALKIYGFLLIGVIGISILPFLLAGYLAYRVYKGNDVNNSKKLWAKISAIAIIGIFLGIPWAQAFWSDTNTTNTTVEEVSTINEESGHTDQKPEIEGIADTSNIEDTTAPNNPNIVHKKVAFVVDGDTFELESGERVRFIGIDTPETPNDCYSKEATQKTKDLIGGAYVGLEKDVSETDKYGRLLRYVYMGDLLINDVLVREGYATAVSYPPDIKFQDQFREAEKEAKDKNRGLWGSICQVKPTSKVASPTPKANVPTPTTITNNNTSGPTGASNSYSCSGPDLDCSDFSTHAEAQAFFDGCGFNANYDPMKLDAVGVGDGIACESLP